MKIPFVFGVTGHRDIPPADVPALEDRIATLLREQKKRFPETPLLLLSALAEGGDRIAANAALHEKVEVTPVLPMPVAEYEKDFTDPRSLQEFRDLLARCSPPIVLGLSGGVDRDTLYEQAGLYIALHCSLLIALWNGHDTDVAGNPAKVGGTAAIVSFRRTNALQEARPLPAFCRRDASVLDAPGLGPLLHIAVKRVSDPRAPLETPSTDSRSALEELKTHLDVYNGEVQRLETSLPDALATSASYLLPNADIDKHSELIDLRQRFAAADALAIGFRDDVQKTLPWIAGLALAAVGTFELFAHVWEESWILLTAYGLFLAAPWAVYLLRVKQRDRQGKYLDYRTLAEALRVQFFWRLAGVPLNAADFYLRRQTGGLVWIRQAARACNIGNPADPATADLALVRARWIADQENFFGKTTVREKRAFHRWDALLTAAYVIGVVTAFGLLLAMIAAMWTDVTLPRVAVQCVVIAMGFAPALAASIGFVLERRAYESHIRQYEMMKHLYTVAGHAMSRASKPADQRAIIEALGREALAENGDWYFTHRVRRVAPARGG